MDQGIFCGTSACPRIAKTKERRRKKTDENRKSMGNRCQDCISAQSAIVFSIYASVYSLPTLKLFFLKTRPYIRIQAAFFLAPISKHFIRRDPRPFPLPSVRPSVFVCPTWSDPFRLYFFVRLFLCGISSAVSSLQ